MKKNLKLVTKDKLTRQFLGFTEEVKSCVETVTEECKAKEERILELEKIVEEHETVKLSFMRSLEQHADHITVLYSKIEELSSAQNGSKS